MKKKPAKKTVSDAFFEIEGLARRIEVLERRGSDCMDRVSILERKPQQMGRACDWFRMLFRRWG